MEVTTVLQLPDGWLEREQRVRFWIHAEGGAAGAVGLDVIREKKRNQGRWGRTRGSHVMSDSCLLLLLSKVCVRVRAHRSQSAARSLHARESAWE